MIGYTGFMLGRCSSNLFLFIDDSVRKWPAEPHGGVAAGEIGRPFYNPRKPAWSGGSAALQRPERPSSPCGARTLSYMSEGLK